MHVATEDAMFDIYCFVRGPSVTPDFGCTKTTANLAICFVTGFVIGKQIKFRDWALHIGDT